MARCPYCRQCVEAEDGMAGKRERDASPQTENENRSGGLDVEDEEIREVKRARSVEREPAAIKSCNEVLFELRGECTATGEYRGTRGRLKHPSTSFSF